tara:strand:+ start:5340 stop:5444 length:105 start_codon:yes stop_codon:yes gene_type:complete
MSAKDALVLAPEMALSFGIAKWTFGCSAKEPLSR